MRRVAVVPAPGSEIKRLILHQDDDGVFVFPCRTLEDRGGTGDNWFISVGDAIAACKEQYGVDESMWQDVGDPEPGCLQDWIAPVRVRSRNQRAPFEVVLERREGHDWVVVPDAEHEPGLRRS